VTIRRPVRLAHAFDVQRTGDVVALLDGDDLIAEARPATVDVAVPRAPDSESVRAAARGFHGAPHHNPGCYGCGPDRRPGDGLGLAPVACPGSDVVASIWAPDASVAGADGVVPAELVWAALDCPGAYALAHPTMVLLGRIAARIDRLPRAGERLRALGWRLGRDGRKLLVATAIVDEAGAALAVAQAVWIELRPGVWERMRG